MTQPLTRDSHRWLTPRPAPTHKTSHRCFCHTLTHISLCWGVWHTYLTVLRCVAYISHYVQCWVVWHIYLTILKCVTHISHYVEVRDIYISPCWVLWHSYLLSSGVWHSYLLSSGVWHSYLPVIRCVTHIPHYAEVSDIHISPCWGVWHTCITVMKCVIHMSVL